jgi:hypothetical protein
MTEDRTDVETSLKNKIFSRGPSFTGTWREVRGGTGKRAETEDL